MLLTNYDFYDIYWSIVLMRSNGLGYDYAVAKAIKDTVDAEQKDNLVEFNKIRLVLSDVKELKEDIKWQWIFTQNVYTYGVKIIKNEFAYQILSAMFEELLECLKSPNEEKIDDLKDALHNIPVILAENRKHFKKHILRQISVYRRKWNKQFLKSLIK